MKQIQQTLLVCALTFVAGHTFAGTLSITNDLGEPVAGAAVHIHQPSGMANFVTDLNGNIDFGALAGGATVTVTANNYMKSEVVAKELTTLSTIQIQQQDAAEKIKVEGEATQFPNLKKDGKVDFALVFPALRRNQLAQFDIGYMMSSDVDEISVVGQTVAVPSNLTLPTQKESYILPITLDKPIYRMLVNQTGRYKMVATHGQFPLKQVISDMNAGKSFFEVINLFKFFSAGQRDINVGSAMKKQDIVVNQIPFDSKIPVSAPAFAAGTEMIAVSLVNQAGLFFPTDVKRMQSATNSELVVPSGSSQNFIVGLMMKSEQLSNMGARVPDVEVFEFASDLDVRAQQLVYGLERLLNALGKDDEDKPKADPAISVALIEAATKKPEFLGLISVPVKDGNSLKMTLPTLPSSQIEPLATYLVLSDVTPAPEGSYGAEKRIRRMEKVYMGWVSQAVIPAVAKSSTGTFQRWEVMYLAKGKKALGVNGEDDLMSQVTHVSRTSIDLQ